MLKCFSMDHAFTSFPNVEKADEDGLLAVGGDFVPGSDCYWHIKNGIFPSVLIEDSIILWLRGVQIHVWS